VPKSSKSNKTSCIGNVKICSKCRVAGYCSKACQRAAWKEGHKNKCDALHTKHGVFENLLKEVDEVHNQLSSEVETRYRVPLCEDFVYDLISNLICALKPVTHGCPSVQVFYKNLGMVIGGESWFYAEADSDVYHDANLHEDEERVYFEMLSGYMYYDSIFVVAQKNPDAFNFSDIYGVAMPSSKYVEMYMVRQNFQYHVTSYEISCMRRDAIKRTKNRLIERFHK